MPTALRRRIRSLSLRMTRGENVSWRNGQNRTPIVTPCDSQTLSRENSLSRHGYNLLPRGSSLAFVPHCGTLTSLGMTEGKEDCEARRDATHAALFLRRWRASYPNG
jgi:hypothetical protein